MNNSINPNSVIKNLQMEVKELEAKLKRSQNDFLNIIGKNKDGILVFDLNGKVIYANPASLDLFGRDLGSLLGEQIGIFIDTTNKTEITIVHKDRGPICLEVNVADTHWNNKPAKLASLRDVTDHKKTTRVLEKLSNFDYLTGLANRVHFEHKLKKAIRRANLIGKKVGLLFLDLDFFKKVNDEYGHQMGDALLVYVSKILLSCVRDTDTVARLGGDEFAIILEGIRTTTPCVRIAKKILKAVANGISIKDTHLNINFSIGIAIYPDKASSMDLLISKADAAMYHSKKNGRGKYYLFLN